MLNANGGTHEEVSKTLTTLGATHGKDPESLTADGGTNEAGSKRLTAMVAHMKKGQTFLCGCCHTSRRFQNTHRGWWHIWERVQKPYHE